MTTPPSPPERPTCPWEQIFVLSLPRSGSTLLRLLLDTHPAIACPGELYLGRLCEALHHALLYSVGQLETCDDDERDARAAAQVKTAIDGMMGRYVEGKGKPLWAEKTPANLEHAERLQRVFPRAAFICLHRHPLDTIRSGLESSRFGRLKYDLWDYPSSCQFYVNETRRLLDFEAKHPDSCLRISYEALVQHPEATAGAIFGFLGLRWKRGLLDAVFSTPHERGPGDPKAEFANRIYATSIGRGVEIVPILRELPRPLQNAIAELGRELGYAPIDFTAPDSVPASAPAPAALAFRSVDEVFRTFVPRKLEGSARAVGDLKGAVKFQVKGAGGGTWTIDLNRRPPIVAPVDGGADCVIAIRADDLLKLASGELNVGECYLQAKLRLQGDESLAVSLGRTLFA